MHGTETWKIEISRYDTQCDTLWKSNLGRYCLTDGTYPNTASGNVLDYILDIDGLRLPLMITNGPYPIKFPRLYSGCSVGQTTHATRVLEQYFLARGIITSPFTFSIE